MLIQKLVLTLYRTNKINVMPIDKQVTIGYTAKSEIADRIAERLNEIYPYENNSVSEAPNGDYQCELYVDGNWWEQNEDITKLSKEFPEVTLNVTTEIFGESPLKEIYLNGVVSKPKSDWLDMTLSEIVAEYGENEPLDGDAVDKLTELIKAKINLFQGNTTEKEPQGEFVDDGSNYQLLDYVFSAVNSDEGFTNIEVRDFDDNVMGEIENLEIPDEFDNDAILNFEREVIEWLQTEDLS